MALKDLLDCTVDVTVGTETLDPVTRRPVTGNTPRHADVPAALHKRTDRAVVYAEDGQVVTDYDCTILVDVVAGDLIVSKAGTTTGTFIVSGEPRVAVQRRRGARVHHYTVPCRRLP